MLLCLMLRIQSLRHVRLRSEHLFVFCVVRLCYIRFDDDLGGCNLTGIDVLQVYVQRYGKKEKLSHDFRPKPGCPNIIPSCFERPASRLMMQKPDYMSQSTNLHIIRQRRQSHWVLLHSIQCPVPLLPIYSSWHRIRL